jgi:hypothetical protein
VTPGNAKVKAGSPLAIRARLVGNRAPIIAQVQIADGDRWRATEMTADGAGGSGSRCRRSARRSSTASRRRRHVADLRDRRRGAAARHAHRRHYTYPAGLRLAPRTEADGGDIYAPAGTDVRVQVFTDRPAASGEMRSAAASRCARLDAANELSASLTVSGDDSYRVRSPTATASAVRATPSTSSASSRIARRTCAC